MKKTLLALLLVLCLMVTLTAFTVSAEETETANETATHTHCVCGGGAVGVHEHACADIVWTPLSEALTAEGLTMQTANFGVLPSGNYYLDGDVTVTAATEPVTGTADAPGQQLSVCLNGHNITASGVTVFGCRKAFTNLNVCDCSGSQDVGDNWSWDSTVTAAAVDGGVANLGADATATVYGGSFVGQTGGAYGSCFNLGEGSSSTALTIYNGYLKGGKTTDTGSVINASDVDATVNIYGGTIEGGGSAMGGGAIYMKAGTLTAENATIIGSTAPRGGAVVVKDGSFTNCTIIGGQSLAKESYTGSQDFNCGGAMAAFGNVTIENTTISDGQAQIGGNIYVGAEAVITIKGNTVIENGHAAGTVNAGGGRASSNTITGHGGNIFVGNYNNKILGRVYMYDGEIRNGTADRPASVSQTGAGGNGGNVHIFGQFYMYGGKVYGGKAMANPAYQYDAEDKSWTAKGSTRGLGGNFHLGNANGGNLLQIEGGYIYDGEAYGRAGGNIYATRGDVNLSGGKIWGGKANADNSVADTSATSGTNYSPMADNDYVTGGSIYITGFGYAGTSKNYIYGARFTMTGGSIGIDADGNAAGGTVTTGGLGGNIYITRDTTYTAKGDSVYLKITGGTIANGTAPGGKGGNIYSYGNDYITVGGTAVISGGSAKYGGNIYYYNYGTFGELKIEGGTITGGNATDKGSGGNIYLGDGGILNMTAGTIEGGVSTGGGGNIYLSGISTKKVTANITGGTVSGGTIPSGYNGGNIRVNNSYATLNIGTEGSTEGPIIENGKATGGSSGGNGGNISNAGTVNIYSGTISGGTATITTSAKYAYGGNIYSTKILNIYGGTITDGDAYRGGNIYVQGTLKIAGGIVTEGVTTVPKGVTGHSEAHGGNIYQEKGTFTMTGGTVSEGNATHNGGNAVICGTFDMTGGEMLNGEGTSGGNIRINASGTMTLDGGTVTGGKARSLSVAGGSGGNTILLLGNKAGLHSTLNVKSGTITGGNGNAVNGGTILMSYGSIVNVTGGTITGGRAVDRTYNNTFYPGRGGVFSLYGVSSTEDGVTTNYPATLNISGGTIQNGESASYGGLISCTKNSTSVEINISGGTFLGGNAPIGGQMWLTHGAVVTISGGTFSGGEASDRAAGIYLGDATLKIVGAPAIQAIHMARAENQLLDVTEMTAEPIVFTFEQTGEHNMLATADVAAYIVNNQGYTITHENDKLYVTAPKAVYVSNNGSDSNNGTAEAPFKTLNFALMTVEDQGTVHVVDAVDVDGWNSHEKHVTVTGGELNITAETRLELKDHVSFKNTTMVMPSEEYYFYCDGFTTLIDQDVNVYYLVDGERQTTSNDSYLYAGSRLTYVVENGELSGTDLTVLSGDWGFIFGGNNTENPLDGDVHLTVGGNVNAGLDYATLGHTAPGSHHVYGGGKSDVNGTVNFTFTGNARAIHIIGCGYGTVHTENVVMNVTGGEGMSVVGGGRGGAQTVGQITVNYDGGTFEQVFGGSLSQGLTGNVDLYLNGGKISRRVYGGCYNEQQTSGLSVSFKTAHQVTGNINMYIGGTDISCDLTEPGKNEKYDDLSIYAHSRYKATGTDAEISSIYFQNKAAYDTYKNKLKYNDALSLGTLAMAQLMGGVTAADNLHYHDYAADGATIKYTCAYDANEFQGITAQLVLDDSVELIYKGKAIEPATIVYGENWTGELEIVYADNNKAGTATASITKDHATATLTFELADGPKMAKIGSTEYYSLQDAVNAATKETFVQLVDNIAEDVTVSKVLYLDLAGYSITGTVTVNEGAVLYGMDSTTDDYDCTEGNGTIKVTGEGTVAAHYKTSVTGKVRRYLTYTEADGSLSFHRIYLGITSMSLRPAVKGVGYKATFRADSKAQELLNTADAFGYTLWLFDKDGNKLSATKGLAKEKFTNEGTVTLRLQNFDVENYGENEIFATVYLQIGEGENAEIITSSEYFYTLRSMIEKINGDTSGYSETQMKALQSMLGDSAEALQTAGWLISNIMNWSAQ